jgi:hypothetical protein
MDNEPHFQLKLAARSTLIGAFFGAAWMYWAAFSFSGNMRFLWLAAVTLPTMALSLQAGSCVRRTRHLISAPDDTERWKMVRRFYWLDVLLEWGLVAFAAAFLATRGHYDLMPATCGVIIGLHYFPLASIFRVSRYYWIGGILVTGSLVSLFIPPGHLRYLAGCWLNGLTLWISALIVLARISPMLRKSSPAPVQQVPN